MNLLSNLGMITLIWMDPQLHILVLFPQPPLLLWPLVFLQQLSPRCLWTYLPRTSQSPSMAVLCNLWSSVSLQILRVYHWQWWFMNSTRPSANPLLYTVSMYSRVCSLLMAGVYMVGMADDLTHTTVAFHLCFCGSNEINHFFYDLPPLFLLSCSDIQVNELALFTVFGFIELSTILGVLVSYCYIIQ